LNPIYILNKNGGSQDFCSVPMKHSVSSGFKVKQKFDLWSYFTGWNISSN